MLPRRVTTQAFLCPVVVPELEAGQLQRGGIALDRMAVDAAMVALPM
jgi:hypothetical protein